ncbi:MAG: hypothetical protein JWL90_3957 [Chthoniobacteraceae bacterium]|nr:hypothetical protein [Chthoniobacteraceae bacterium]
MVLALSVTSAIHESRGEDRPQPADKEGYIHESGDLNAFLERRLVKLGGHQQHIFNLPEIKADWRYKEEKDGLEVRISGDYAGPLHPLFILEFQARSEPPKNDVLADINPAGAKYYAPEFAAALSYDRERSDGQEKLITKVIVKIQTRLLHPDGVRNEAKSWSRWNLAEGGNDHRYKAVSVRHGITWTEADAQARAEGGYLTTITSKPENSFVFSLVNSPEFFTENGGGPALGGFQQDRAPEPDGGWCWISGDPWNYSNWHSGEPTNGRISSGTEDRLQFFSGISREPAATWNDVNRNDMRVGGYVIERND